MEFVITETQLENLLEDIGPFQENLLMRIFKFLDEEKKKTKTKSEILDKIKTFSKYTGLPEGFEIFLLELYLLNFRKDGDYSSLTKGNYVDPRFMKGKRITNPLADQYTKAQMPFRGSNLEGRWEKDGKGKQIYVVHSFDWYPIYIFKDNRWYEVTQRYSSSTGRQMSNANPVEWDEKFDDKVYLLTPHEMKMLLRGYSHDEIMKHKLTDIKAKEPELISKKTNIVRPYNFGPITPISIKYKIKSIDTEGDKPVINVDVVDVLKRKNNISLNTPENYLKGELHGIDKEYVEDKLSQNLKGKFRDFVGPRIRYHGPLKDIHKIKFNFNHLRK